jgi:hypothetical protein
MQNSRRYEQKTNFNCRIDKKRKALKWEKIHSSLIHLQFSNNYFTDEFAFQLCTRPEKFACLSLKIRAGEKLFLIARYKN